VAAHKINEATVQAANQKIAAEMTKLESEP
jgi:hypothetical protein